jgi:hypothetical protein
MFFDNRVKSILLFTVFNIVLSVCSLAASRDTNVGNPTNPPAVLIHKADHPYHVSHTEIHTTDSSITFVIEVFTDDLEFAVKQLLQPEKYFLGDTLSQSSFDLTEKYYAHVTQIVVNGKPLNEVLFFDVQSTPDRTTLYVEVKNTATIQSFALHSTLLIDAFSDQENIVELHHKDSIQKALLHKGKATATFTFE